jgi:hypothetical protein
MKKNMGSTDKIIRILVAVIIGLLYYTKFYQFLPFIHAFWF